MVILAALLRLGDDAYGVSIRREIEERSGRLVSIGAVYTTLNRLEDKGFARSHVGEPSPIRGGRARRYFRIDARGKRALAQSLRSLSRMVDGLSLHWGSA